MPDAAEHGVPDWVLRIDEAARRGQPPTKDETVKMVTQISYTMGMNLGLAVRVSTLEAVAEKHNDCVTAIHRDYRRQRNAFRNKIAKLQAYIAELEGG